MWPIMTANKCPVCDMDAKDSTIIAGHTGIEYHFCSRQCRENFLARPTLYVGKQSAMLAGKAIIKRRTFLLDCTVEKAVEQQLINVLQKMMGVGEVQINGREIAVSYNLLEATAEQLERAISDAGAALGSGWAARLKHGWMYYTEENELDNLSSDGGPCCNKPPTKG